MKRCASCGHPEVDHEGLSCRSPEATFGAPCACRGFEDPDEPEGFSLAQLSLAWEGDASPGQEVFQLTGVRIF